MFGHGKFQGPSDDIPATIMGTIGIIKLNTHACSQIDSAVPFGFANVEKMENALTLIKTCPSQRYLVRGLSFYLLNTTDKGLGLTKSASPGGAPVNFNIYYNHFNSPKNVQSCTQEYNIGSNEISKQKPFKPSTQYVMSTKENLHDF